MIKELQENIEAKLDRYWSHFSIDEQLAACKSMVKHLEKQDLSDPETESMHNYFKFMEIVINERKEKAQAD